MLSCLKQCIEAPLAILFLLHIALGEILMTDLINYETPERDTVLDPSDFLNAEIYPSDANLTHLGIRFTSDPISTGKAEGDIALPNIKEFVKNSNQLGRNAIKSRWRRWPNGEIPYVLSSRYDDGCYSLVGRTGGRQPLSLDAGCIQTGTVIHELMHSVGFFHEQSRNDRDEWIEIVWDNVMSNAKDQFDKYSLRTITHLDEEYDYDSIMHYGPYAFTRNGRKTILPRKSGGRRMGQREGFSRIDLTKINKLYHCDLKSTEDTAEEEEEDKEETITFPSISKPSSGKCEDNNWRCFFWSLGAINFCERYEKVRTEICPKSCGTCKEGEKTSERKPSIGTSTTTTTTSRPRTRRPTTTTTTKPKVSTRGCRDDNTHCTKWSRKKLCTKPGYAKFMEKKCAKSCGFCGTSVAESRTINTESEIEDESNCKDNPGYNMQCHFIKQLGIIY